MAYCKYCTKRHDKEFDCNPKTKRIRDVLMPDIPNLKKRLKKRKAKLN